MIDNYIVAAGAVLDEAEAEWDQPKVDELLAATKAKIQRRRRLRSVFAAVAAIAVLGTGGAVAFAHQSSLGAATPEHWAAIDLPALSLPEAEELWGFRIGESRVQRLRDDTVLAAHAPQGEHSHVEISSGSARFDAHALIVTAGEHRISAEHAVFVVDRSVSPAAIFVEDGEIRIESGTIARTLAAGENGELAGPEKPRAKGKKQRPKWRRLVTQGRYEEAYEAMKTVPTPSVTRSADSLMAAADAARHSGHPKEASGYLKRVVAEHPKHALAPLASFTVGRIYLERLGHPRLAADAFAKARKLKPGMQFAEDALAREVQAWAKAGDHAKAEARAREYLKRYPDGRRAQRVRKHAGL